MALTFRARKLNGEFFYFDVTKLNEMRQCHYRHNVFYIDDTSCLKGSIEPGMRHKDRNGVEVYVGDVIKAEKYGIEIIGRIVYCDIMKDFCVEVLEDIVGPRVEGDDYDSYVGTHILLSDFATFEKIGDIHNNPEYNQDNKKLGIQHR